MTTAVAKNVPSVEVGRNAYAYDVIMVSGMLFCCTFLQRFGVPFGSKQLNIVGPVGVALALWGLWTNTLVVDRRRFVIFLAMLCLVLIG